MEGKMLKSKIVVLALLAGAIAMPALADVGIGGDARFVAMGGAGLASTVGPDVIANINPAALGMLPRRFKLEIPNCSFASTGVGVSSFNGYAGDVWSLSGPEGIDLARRFGTTQSTYDITVGTGLSVGPANLMALGEAGIKIIPNAAFREFATTGTLPADPTTMRATVWGEATTSIPAIGFGFKVPSIATGNGDLWIGTRLRYVKGTYVRRTVEWSGDADPDNLLQISEEPAENASGIAGDLGVIYKVPGHLNMSYGVVATNLLKPNLGNIRQGTIWSMGVSAQPNSKMLFVADLVNLTGAYDESTQLRFGAEFRPIRALAFRAGYSGDAVTTGIGIFGLDLVYSPKMPVSISRTLRF